MYNNKLEKTFMNKKGATIYDISKKINVSVATVSRALNDHPRISQATKDLVKKTDRPAPESAGRSVDESNLIAVGYVTPDASRRGSAFVSTIIFRLPIRLSTSARAASWVYPYRSWST